MNLNDDAKRAFSVQDYFVDTHFAPAHDQCDEGRLPWDFAGAKIWEVVRG